MALRPGIVVVVAAVAAAAALVLLRAPDDVRYVEAGVPAPGFALPRLADGTPVALDSLRGRVVLLNFWATWCKPCEDEMPSMERLYRQLAGSGFELLAVSVDEPGTDLAAFRDRFGLSFPILLDSEREVAGDYQTHHFPESFLIGPDGVVLQRYIGPREWDAPEYQARIRELLARVDR